MTRHSRCLAVGTPTRGGIQCSDAALSVRRAEATASTHSKVWRSCEVHGVEMGRRRPCWTNPTCRNEHSRAARHSGEATMTDSACAGMRRHHQAAALHERKAILFLGYELGDCALSTRLSYCFFNQRRRLRGHIHSGDRTPSYYRNARLEFTKTRGRGSTTRASFCSSQ